MSDPMIMYFIPLAITLCLGWVIQGISHDDDDGQKLGGYVAWMSLIPIVNMVIATFVLIVTGIAVVSALVYLPTLVIKFKD